MDNTTSKMIEQTEAEVDSDYDSKLLAAAAARQRVEAVRHGLPVQNALTDTE
jgi:hypothetical protein